MDPVQVLALARHLSGRLPRVLVVGCEPATVLDIETDELSGELSEPVRASLDAAVRMIESVLDDIVNENKEPS
jgi:Ni,Fe-hydrogenase maturation factor